MNWSEQMLSYGCHRASRRVSTSLIFYAIARFSLLTSVLTATIDAAFSQDASAWQLPHGVKYSHIVRQEPRPLHIHVITIDLRTEGLSFSVSRGQDPDGDGLAEAILTPPAELAKDADAVAAINTSAWEMLPDPETGKKPGYIAGGWSNILGWVQNGDEIISKPQAGYWSVWMDDSRHVYIGEVFSEAKLKEMTPKVQWAVSGFRGILADGKVLVAPSEVRHPRTAAGITADHRTLVWMVIDGRQNGYSEGVSEEELARLLLEQNCDDGINLDGGGSSSMWIRNAQSELSTANRPSDATGPRPVPVVLNLRSPKSDPSK
ncbi:MAG: phosphodiester glycosidase family protein [Pirellula sp.]